MTFIGQAHTRRRVGNNGDAGVEAPPLNRKPFVAINAISVEEIARSLLSTLAY
jgi:hypothetical protein